MCAVLTNANANVRAGSRKARRAYPAFNQCVLFARARCTMSRSRDEASHPQRWRAVGALTRPCTIRQQMREPSSSRAPSERTAWRSLNTPTKFRDSANFFYFRASVAMPLDGFTSYSLPSFSDVRTSAAITSRCWRLNICEISYGEMEHNGLFFEF